MDKNNLFLKIQGKVSIPSELEIDKNYKITCDCSVTQIKRDTNEDGTYSVTFKAEPLTASVEGDNGKVIKARDPRRNSAKIRNVLWKQHFDEGGTDDFQDVYDSATYVILSMMPAIYREAIKRLQKHD